MTILRQCEKCKNYVYKKDSVWIILEEISKKDIITKRRTIWCKACYQEVTEPRLDLKTANMRIDQ